MDVLDFGTKSLCTKVPGKILDLFPKWQKKMVLSRDTDAEDMLAERHIYRTIYFADCQGMVEDRIFIQMMKRLLKSLEENYHQPVDIEFAVNAVGDKDWSVTLVQCRPLVPEFRIRLRYQKTWMRSFCLMCAGRP